ncbi:Hypothetical predicted protein [Octopus vulgaris]|uniref:Uncharacterized protein n=1 Tax=Octopus vulgaris TaxID=6645 RepID=A0AA36BNG6_OCTVU|nr:Hypothetical predicted protein [Octopus vulgaris]
MPIKLLPLCACTISCLQKAENPRVNETTKYFIASATIIHQLLTWTDMIYCTVGVCNSIKNWGFLNKSISLVPHLTIGLKISVSFS